MRGLSNRFIKAYDASEKEIRSLLEIASRDFSTAENIVGINPDWAYNISYNAMFQPSRALMLWKGFRPRGPSQHTNVVLFVKQTIGEEHPNLVVLFDQMRRRRNRLVYDVVSLVGSTSILAISFINLRPHGCEPSGLNRLPRSTRNLDFASRVVNLLWVAVWTTVVF